MKEQILKVRNLRVKLGGDQVIRDLSFEVNKRETVVVSAMVWEERLLDGSAQAIL